MCECFLFQVGKCIHSALGSELKIYIQQALRRNNRWTCSNGLMIPSLHWWNPNDAVPVRAVQYIRKRNFEIVKCLRIKAIRNSTQLNWGQVKLYQKDIFVFSSDPDSFFLKIPFIPNIFTLICFEFQILVKLIGV